jgi:hypothetical protein
MRYLNHILAFLMPFVMAGHAVATLQIVPGTAPEAVELGAEFGPIQVRVTDADGNPVSGARLTWPKGFFRTRIVTLNPDYRYCPFDPLASCGVTADGQGIAVLPRMYSQNLGIQTLDIRGQSPFGQVPSTDLGTVRLAVNFIQPSRLSSLAIIGGDGQSALRGAPLPQSFSVQALAFDGQPLVGKQVRFETFVFTGQAEGRFPNGATSASATTDANGIAVSPTLTVGLALGTGEITAFIEDSDYHLFPSRRLSFTVRMPDGSTILPLQDMWWSGFEENGWGMSIAQHEDRLFSVIYAYGIDGRPTWYVIPDGRWTPGGRFRNYSGPTYSPRGSPYFAYDATRFAAGTAMPTESILNFRDRATFPDDEATSFLRFGQSEHFRKTIVRQDFTSDTPAPITGLGDMWWGGPAQNGWGIAIMEQHGGLFSVWLTYGADSLPTWFVMPSGTWTSANTYEGTIYRTLSSSWPNYDVRQLQVIAAGSFRYTFHGMNSATFDYAADGHSGSLSISRQDF